MKKKKNLGFDKKRAAIVVVAVQTTNPFRKEEEAAETKPINRSFGNELRSLNRATSC